MPTMHGFDEFLGNLYHLNAEEEPENDDYPSGEKYPNFKKSFGPRGVMRSKADGKGGQTLEDTGPVETGGINGTVQRSDMFRRLGDPGSSSRPPFWQNGGFFHRSAGELHTLTEPDWEVLFARSDIPTLPNLSVYVEDCVSSALAPAVRLYDPHFGFVGNLHEATAFEHIRSPHGVAPRPDEHDSLLDLDQGYERYWREHNGFLYYVEGSFESEGAAFHTWWRAPVADYLDAWNVERNRLQSPELADDPALRFTAFRRLFGLTLWSRWRDAGFPARLGLFDEPDAHVLESQPALRAEVNLLVTLDPLRAMDALARVGSGVHAAESLAAAARIHQIAQWIGKC